MKTCGDCKLCTGKDCKLFRAEKLRNYDGLRFTADGFDCALPVAFDTYSTCSFGCLYCFSNFLIRDPHKKGEYTVGKHRFSHLENFLTLDPERIGKRYRPMQNALRRPDGKRCPIQWGALGDPFDNIERWQGDAIKIANLFVKYKQPTRISTKGGLVVQHKEYLDALSYPEIFWVAFSIITSDDEMSKKVDIGAPVSEDRFKAMKELSKRGVKTSLRFRPIIPGISDHTENKSKIWKDLIDKAADAGAKAISMEFMFVPMVQTPIIKKRMRILESLSGVPLTDFYKRTTPVKGACLRGWKYWKEDLVFACKDYAKKNGLTFGVSDPHWKELNDYGCCCGISPDDPVFGNWERENATNALIIARDKFKKEGKAEVYFKNINPDWAKDVPLRDMVCITKARGEIATKHLTWESKLRDQWNEVRNYRSPLHYFGDVLMPGDVDKNGDRIYNFTPVKRKYKKYSWDT